MKKITLLLAMSVLLIPVLNANARIMPATSKPKPKYMFTMTKPIETDKLVFEHEFLAIGFVITYDRFAFELLNKTNNLVKINWNETTFIDSDAQSHRVIHSGIKFIDKEKEQQPTIVPPSAKVSDVILPTDYVEYRNVGLLSAQYVWSTYPFLPKADKKEAQQFIGRSLGLFMSLEVNGEVKNYHFSFKINIVRE